MLKSCFTCEHFDSCTLICKFADFITTNANSTISNECNNWIQKTDKSEATIYIKFIENEQGYRDIPNSGIVENSINNIIDNTLTCDFCHCKFEITKENIEIIKEFSAVGHYHKDIYKIIRCPICNEIVKKRKFVEE